MRYGLQPRGPITGREDQRVDERIGELLVRENRLSAEQLGRAQREARAKGVRLGAQITQLGYLDETELKDFIAREYGVPSIELEAFEIDPEILKLVPEHLARKHNVVPVNRAGSTLILATADPSDMFALDDIKFLTGYNIQAVVASEESIARFLEQAYEDDSELAEVMAGFDDSDIDVVHDEEKVLSRALTDVAVLVQDYGLVEARQGRLSLGQYAIHVNPGYLEAGWYHSVVHPPPRRRAAPEHVGPKVAPERYRYQTEVALQLL